MKTYKLGITRTYIVSVEAEDDYQARMYAEFYLGNPPDLSTEKDRVERIFSIQEIEMVYNEAHDIEEIGY